LAQESSHKKAAKFIEERLSESWNDFSNEEKEKMLSEIGAWFRNLDEIREQIKEEVEELELAAETAEVEKKYEITVKMLKDFTDEELQDLREKAGILLQKRQTKRSDEQS
jgi:ABC-type ATPase with predicted acetyltransferase domain